MELWDVYDSERRLTDRTIIRGNAFQKGDYHLVIHVCVFNSEGQMLIQRRQPFKENWSDMWDITVGGSAVHGENSQSAAERETEEELGLRINLQGIRPNLTINYDRGFDDIYLVEQEVDLEDLTLQYEEVQAVKWATEEEILTMIEQGTFIPYFASLIKLFFETRKQYGCHNRK